MNRLESWSEYLEPIGWLLGCVMALLFFYGVVLGKTAFVTALMWLCLCVVPMLLVGVGVCFWLNRGAAAELRDIVTGARAMHPAFWELLKIKTAIIAHKP